MSFINRPFFSFGNLFSGTETRSGGSNSPDALGPYVNMKYDSPTGGPGGSGEGEVGPALSAMRAKSSAERKATARGVEATEADKR